MQLGQQQSTNASKVETKNPLDKTEEELTDELHRRINEFLEALDKQEPVQQMVVEQMEGDMQVE
jgi:hypothetical protein